jgi:ribonucleoside-diphosphate reductase alpha chain
MDLQAASFDVWKQKYQLKDEHGTAIDKDVDSMFQRVAKTLASVESNSEHWYERFLWAMRRGAYPAGRILANAGAQGYKPNTTLINCTVSRVIDDSIEGIMLALSEAASTLKTGAGIGYDFSTLRPKGAYVRGAGAKTSGSLSFMDIFDKMCFTISSAGGRRGAQMATMRVDHPDIIDFIKAKRENGRLRQFNMSVLVTDSFMHAVDTDLDWQLCFAGKVYKTVKACDLWDLIMRSTYDYAEPGVLFIDRINEGNPLGFIEQITATNPCAEQPLPPNGACLLGSVDLTKFVRYPFSDDAVFNYEDFIEVVSVFARMLDNVVDINNLPLESQRQEIMMKRRHGMGFLGLGSALTMLKIKYGSPEAIRLARTVSIAMARTNYETGVDLAYEKGAAPILKDENNLKNYVDRIKKLGYVNDDYLRKMEAWGCRYTHATSIAPTGTLSLSVGNNVSNGIEPTFCHEYARNVIIDGKKTKEKVNVLSYEYLRYKSMHPEATVDTLPDYFVTSDSITPEQHVDMQAACQPSIDSSISKTINVPTDISFDAFKDIYRYAFSKGLKGCTTFRFNPEAFQGVLVKESDLKNTIYNFKLENGETVSCTGDTIITYDGENHTAANLYDAIKEGYYGKF